MSRVQEGHWEASIFKLLENFHQGLVALIPIADSVKIPWKDGEAYDDWDSLTSKLYGVFVSNPIIHDIDQSSGAFKMPPYDMAIQSYENYSWIEIEGCNGDPIVFTRFPLRGAPFEEVEGVFLYGSSFVAGQSVVLPWPGPRVWLRRRYHDGSSELLDYIRNEI